MTKATVPTFYFICIVLVYLVIQGTECRNCGSSPNLVHLSRGEKRRIEFWSNEKDDSVIDLKLSPESAAALRFSASDPAEMPENREVVNVGGEEPVIESKDFLHQVETRVDKPQADSLTLDNIVAKNANDAQVVPATTDLVNHESHEDISVTTEVFIDQTQASLQRNINKQTLHIDFEIKEIAESDFVTTTLPDVDFDSTDSTLNDFKLRSEVQDSTAKSEDFEFDEKSSQTEVPESATLGDFQETSDHEGFTEIPDINSGEGKHAPNQDGLPVTTDSDFAAVTEVPQEDSFKFFPVVLSEDVIEENGSSPSTSADFISKHSEHTLNEDQILTGNEIDSTEDSTERALEGVGNRDSFTNEIESTEEGDFATERSITREDQIWQGPDFAPGTERSLLDAAQDVTETNLLDSAERHLQGNETGTESEFAHEVEQTEANLLSDPEDLRFDVPTEPALLQSDPEAQTESDISAEPPVESLLEKLIQSSPLSEDRIWQGTDLGTLKADIDSDVHNAASVASANSEPLSTDHILPGTQTDTNAISEDQTSQESEVVSPNANKASGTEERTNAHSVLSEDQFSQGNDFGSSIPNSVSDTADEMPEVTAPSLAEEDVTEVTETKSLEKDIVQESVMSVITGEPTEIKVETPIAAAVEDSSNNENGSDSETLEPKVEPSNEDILFHIKNIISTFSRRDDSAEVKNSTTRNKFFGLERFFLRRSKRSKPVDPFFEIPAPDLSSSQHEKKLTSEQEQLFHAFMKESGSHMIHEEDKIDVKDDVVDVKVTGVLPFGPSVSQPAKVRGTVDTVVGKINPRWRRGEESESESWISRLKSSLVRFMESRPLPLRRALLLGSSGRNSKTISEDKKETTECDWNIKTEPGLYLLVTFHNLSAPYTLDCHGAYIEVEREANGFEARWCGNKIGQQRGTRSHVIFARSEVRISVFDDGTEGKSWPTGFSAEAEVIDLHDAGHYASFRRSDSYSSVSRLVG